jgi:hypothetical protein
MDYSDFGVAFESLDEGDTLRDAILSHDLSEAQSAAPPPLESALAPVPPPDEPAAQLHAGLAAHLPAPHLLRRHSLPASLSALQALMDPYALHAAAHATSSPPADPPSQQASRAAFEFGQAFGLSAETMAIAAAAAAAAASFQFHQQNMQGGLQVRKKLKYSKEDDDAIMNYLQQAMAAGFTGSASGNRIWKEMEQKKITAHSWQSMRDHYLKTLLPLSRNEMPKRRKKRFSVDGNAEMPQNLKMARMHDLLTPSETLTSLPTSTSQETFTATTATATTGDPSPIALPKLEPASQGSLAGSLTGTPQPRSPMRRSGSAPSLSTMGSI